MFKYQSIPLHPTALLLIFVLGLIMLFRILYNQYKYRNEKEKAIADINFIYPILLLGASSSGIVYLFFSGALNNDIMGKLVSQLF
ncbi:hypothetical protein [Chryseobacterium bernardetii]|uniref:hypothetical protein n=1 Tax=Chryseobacterium bernardetii TaxID=1241978 RepID=UPI0016256A67|nr:hypothetical protein [Chryseobacterium bernardetii]